MSWTVKKAERRRIDAFELWCWRRLLRVPWTARRSVMGVHWKDWCWSWNFNTLATWCKELTHWKRPWCWERLRAGEGNDRGWDSWMASPTQWTWVWVDSGSWWWTGRPGVLRFTGSQRVRHNWATELNNSVQPSPLSFSRTFHHLKHQLSSEYPKALLTSTPLSASMNFSILSTSCNWNHSSCTFVCSLFHLAWCYC